MSDDESTGDSDPGSPGEDLPSEHEDGGSGTSSLVSGAGLLGVGIIAAVVFGLLYLVRPWLHGIVYGVFIKNPALVMWVVVAIALLVAAAASRSPLGTQLLSILALVVFVYAVLFSAVIAGAQTNIHLAEEMQDGAETLEEIPKTNSSTPRILPQSVATQFAQNSLQFPRHQLGTADITFINGTPHWSYPLKPDGLVNKFQGKQNGAVYVNMSTSNKSVSTAQSEFNCGQGQLITDDYKWKLKKSKFFVEYKDPFMVEAEDSGDLYMAVPYVRHDVNFRLDPVPQPYSVPKFAGVALIDKDCNIQHLSPEEARSNNVLEGQNIYPYSLARKRVNAMQYKKGALNAWVTHEDQLQIADLPSGSNSQPFTVPTENGITYFVAAEPWGDASGVYQIWTIDARTGDAAVRRLPRDSSLIGPNKAANFVEQENPRVNWGSNSPSEPIPTVRNGTLYWQVRVIPDSSAGITYTAFVNANSGEVTRYRTDDRIVAFLAGENVSRLNETNETTDDGSADGPSGGDSGLVVVILDEDGNPVRTVPVEGNQSVQVRSRTNSTTASG